MMCRHKDGGFYWRRALSTITNSYCPTDPDSSRAHTETITGSPMIRHNDTYFVGYNVDIRESAGGGYYLWEAGTITMTISIGETPATKTFSAVMPPNKAPPAPPEPVPTTATVLFDVTVDTYTHGDWLTPGNKFWQAYGFPANDIVFPDPGESYLLSSLTVVSQPFTDTGIHFDIRTYVSGQKVLFVWDSDSQTYERTSALPDKTTFDPGDNLVIEHKDVASDDPSLGEYYILSLTSTTGNTVHIKVKPDGSYAD